ncbi:hypothetical protein INT43_004761 [Umbelopsis isabellina]|uniref:Transcription factor domain-containing protein n=1 Tax=Mortierella isabellina TaxID=91625 RepID=A0A8H7U7V3_MORIS|nr:hypothetical protein INT43_004761 [Umbelopsis isabellina]
MPFATVERSLKRSRCLPPSATELYASHHSYSLDYDHPFYAKTHDRSLFFDYLTEQRRMVSPPTEKVAITGLPTPIERESPMSSPSFDDDTLLSAQFSSHLSGHSDGHENQSITSSEDITTFSFEFESASTPVSPPETPTSQLPQNALCDALSKFSISYTDQGLKMEAKVGNVSELRALMDSIPQLANNQQKDTPKNSTKAIICRNKHTHAKPANLFQRAWSPGKKICAPTCKPQMSRQQIVDACIQTYFDCWVRYSLILTKEEFMAYKSKLQDPLDDILINAICAHSYKHTVTHHATSPEMAMLACDQDKLQEQVNYYFNKARVALAQSFDAPDRYTIIALLFMSTCTEKSRSHLYTGMAISALHQLKIYPRMAKEDVEECSYQKEMDTRLWWYAWSIDLYHHSGGAPKNTPQLPFPGEIGLPTVYEQDIDDTEIGVLVEAQCMQIWQIQADIVEFFYESDSDTIMSAEQLQDFESRLESWRIALPPYFQLDSGFEYGSEDMFLGCLRVHLEYNATMVILQKLFIPELGDASPTKTSLQALNKCLRTATIQLKILNTCQKLPLGHCGFDRDELWRAAEIISLSLEVYNTVKSQADKRMILNGVRKSELETGLPRALNIIKGTREWQTDSRNWTQVSDWLEIEIAKLKLPPGQVDEKMTNKPAAYFSANLKPGCALRKSSISDESTPQVKMELEDPTLTSVPVGKHRTKSSPSAMLSVLSFPMGDTSMSRKSSVAEPILSTPKPSIPIQFHNNFGPSPQHFVQDKTPPSNFVRNTSHSAGSKNQPRFRYFNPRKMNKFMFIDEHPIA